MAADTAFQVRTGDPVDHLWGLGRSPIANQAINCLRHGNVWTIADLLKCGARDLRDIRGLGAGSLAEVRRVLGVHGLALKGEEAPGGQ